MIKRMKEALTADHTLTDEDTIDALRAFTFLLHHIATEKLKKDVSRSTSRETAALAMDIITMLPVSDHQSLIQGKPWSGLVTKEMICPTSEEGNNNCMVVYDKIFIFTKEKVPILPWAAVQF